MALYFLQLGATGFGGPIALAGSMQRTLVEERRWVSPDEYIEGLALAQLAPGPLAAQLAMYLAYIRGGVAGATLSGIAFILPSFLIVWALAAAYVRYGGLWWMHALFHGIGAAVIGIMFRSVMRLGGMTLARDPLRWTIAAALAITTAVTGRENIALFVLAGFAPLIVRKLDEHKRHHGHKGRTQVLTLVSFASLVFPERLATILPPDVSLIEIGWFFTRAGAFVFGSGLAVVPFLYGGVVIERHWLTDRQFLDAVAVAMITPGPVVITVAFIGYLVRGSAGMLAAAAGVFLPVYLVVVVAAPWFRRYHGRTTVKTFVSGVTAAATGAIAGAAVLLGTRALVDGWTMAIAAVTFAVLWRWRVSELWLIAAAGGLGLWLR